MKHTFIKKTLEKILSDKELKKAHHAELKKACESANGNTLFDIFIFLKKN